MNAEKRSPSRAQEHPDRPPSERITILGLISRTRPIQRLGVLTALIVIIVGSFFVGALTDRNPKVGVSQTAYDQVKSERDEAKKRIAHLRVALRASSAVSNAATTQNRAMKQDLRRFRQAMRVIQDNVGNRITVENCNPHTPPIVKAAIERIRAQVRDLEKMRLIEPDRLAPYRAC